MKIITLGREHGNNVIINDPQASRNHCQIIRQDDGNFLLIDNNSKNGTYVNGSRRQGQITLNRSDVITIGNTNIPWQSYFNNNEIGTIADNNFAGKNYNSQLPQPNKGNGFGIAAICCGVVGIFILGVLFGTLAIIFGGISLNRREKLKGLGITGLILGIIAVIVCIIYITVIGSIGLF